VRFLSYASKQTDKQTDQTDKQTYSSQYRIETINMMTVTTDNNLLICKLGRHGVDYANMHTLQGQRITNNN